MVDIFLLNGSIEAWARIELNIARHHQRQSYNALRSVVDDLDVVWGIDGLRMSATFNGRIGLDLIFLALGLRLVATNGHFELAGVLDINEPVASGEDDVVWGVGKPVAPEEDLEHLNEHVTEEGKGVFGPIV